ncbi:terminase family protein [bacterium]|nr:terminase family protein [bacterium]
MKTDASIRLRLAKLLWGWKPHKTQRQWMLNEAKVKVASCGRRWGKTESAAIDAATMAIFEPGSVQMIVSATYDQARLIFDSVERLVTGSKYLRHAAKAVRTPYPRLTIGRSIITARTADEDGRNLRGNSADRIIVDEAAYVRDCVIQEVISPMLADRDGRLVMISTPFGKNHFYRAFMRGIAESNSKRHASFSFPSWTNPHISREYIEEQRHEISPRQFAVEYEAAFIDDQCSVFSWKDIEFATAHSDTAAADSDYVVAGIDWARYSDYTAVVAMSISDSGCRVIGIDRFNAMSWNSQIERVVDFLCRYRVSSALTDQSSIGDPLLEQLKSKLWECGADISVEGYTFTNQSKRDLIENLSLQFAHNAISIPHDEALMRELQYYEYELTDSGNVRMNARSGYHDDLVIALALACHQAKSSGFSGRYLSRNGSVAAEEW